MNRKVYAWSLVLALALALLMGGCAAMRQEEAQKTDDLLAAAGFKVRPADTPEKLAHLKAMQPLKMSMRTKDGRVIYSYADPYNCQCVYVGGPEEFAQYQRLREQPMMMWGKDPDYAQRDLFTAIAKGDFPKWHVCVQLMPEKEAETYHINPFDLTKVWPHRDYPLVDVGELVLDRNPVNYLRSAHETAYIAR